MRYVSLFSGIEAASVAWEPLEWEPVAFAEIEPFPCALLAERFPEVPNLGDVVEIDWKEFLESHGTVDLVVGGSPCQSFSVAGRREGLAGESGLMFEYIRCVRELRPRWFVWENVPGALSSEGGEAFRQLLSEMDALGYGMAWRVLDAQFFGVPQRRERVFLVGCLGDPERAAQVLLEPEMLRGDMPSSKAKRQELAENAARGAGREAGSLGFNSNKNASARSMGEAEEQSTTRLADTHQPATCYGITPGISRTTQGTGIYEDQCPTLRAVANNLTPATCYAIRTAQTSSNGWGVGDNEAHTLDCAGPEAVCYPEVNCLTPWDVQSKRVYAAGGNGPALPSGTGEGMNIQPVVCYAQNQRYEVRESGGDGGTCGALPSQQSGEQFDFVCQPVVIDRAAFNQGGNAKYDPSMEESQTMPTLVAKGPHAVSYAVDCRNHRVSEEISGTLQAKPNGGYSLNFQNPVTYPDREPQLWEGELRDFAYALRRLMPVECERLQGFPDGWTDVEFKGKPSSDTARYKALGNSMAVPCMMWIGERIQMVDEILEG